MHANQRSPWRPICFRCRVRCGGKAVWSPPVRQTDFSSSSHGRILDSLCQICPELLAVPWIKISACGKQVTGSARLRSFVASCPLQNGDARAYTVRAFTQFQVFRRKLLPFAHSSPARGRALAGCTPGRLITPTCSAEGSVSSSSFLRSASNRGGGPSVVQA